RPQRPCYKPDFDAELLLSVPYTGQLTVWRRALCTPSELFGSPEGDGLHPAALLHDLTLRLSERTEVLHLPALLYERRRLVPEGQAAPAALSAELSAITQAALRRRTIAATVAPGPTLGSVSASLLLRRTLQDTPTVAVVIPFRDQPALLKAC